MGVVTKTGDKGETGRFGGARVPKDDPGVCANGDIDELNSAIGLFLARPDMSEQVMHDLRAVQSACFTIGAEIATPPDAPDESRSYIPRIAEADVFLLEERITAIESLLSPQKHFLLPGGVPAAAMAYWIRTITRRAERSVVHAHGAGPFNPLIIKYLNRLSDYWYVLARFLNQQRGIAEPEWRGGIGPIPPQSPRRAPGA
ncbi:MAG: cob(I)yrinic acid a,c-diamide adenosyltransferase [Parcubacteria group bacterium]|nr:cob(I)yrinic acid a,c-diamide adenosyltransferase [Parcubacteria group bacterium]